MTRALFLAAFLLLSGCERLARNMYEQPGYRPMRASPLWPDGTSARPPVPGTVPAGADRALERARENPLPLTMPLLARGRERFDIFCAPCHSPVGDGDGMVARRGFPHPPSYHTERLRNAPDRHFFDAMTQGYGVMKSYADRIPAEERWAIVAYIRALQLSQYAEVKAQ
jgi:mono/diheme cytochrome c family protein